MNIAKRLFQETRRTRAMFVLLADIALVALSMYAAFLLRFEGRIPSQYMEDLWILILVAMAVKIPVFYLQRLYHISWSYVSVRELMSVFTGGFFSSLLLGTALFVLKAIPTFTGFPRSILFIDFFLTITLIGGFRAAKRVYLQFVKGFPVEGKRTLIVGAGDAGEQLLRSMLKSGHRDYLPIGFVDDDPGKLSTSIQGIKVLGTRKEIPQLVEAYDIEELLIAIPSVSSKVIKETVEVGRKAKVKSMKILPDISEILSGSVGLADVREVQPEDLLGREPVSIDTRALERFLRGKTVLVTGAAGSVGAELCRQILRFGSTLVFALDSDETGLFNLEKDLQRRFSASTVRILVGDVRDRMKMTAVLQHHRPQVVFHAAAYKHVPIMEAHPEEAVKTNVFGTQIVVEEACRAGAEAFVFISTDKAINPTSVMGATKRVAEMVVLGKGKESATRLMAVRFGNVLGSRGSALPLFTDQIKRGGPVTVTHPEMQRYFMTTAEAVLLVLQAAAMGQGGEVFVLDMGKPVRVLDLAKELIRFHGLEPDQDIPIVFSGIRPGEKLYEELLTAEEGTDATSHERVFVARMGMTLGREQTKLLLERLRQSAEDIDRELVVSCLQQLVPTYRSFKDAHSGPEIEGHGCN